MKRYLVRKLIINGAPQQGPNIVTVEDGRVEVAPFSRETASTRFVDSLSLGYSEGRFRMAETKTRADSARETPDCSS